MFMRKYIHLAKSVKPQLTKEAADLISEEYTKLRNQETAETGENMAKTQPITARTLETLIRLATAHAKARLCNKVEARDADVAIELIRFACFKKVLEKERRKKKSVDEEEEEEEEEEMEEAEVDKENTNGSQQRKRGGKSNKRRMEESDEEMPEENEEEGEVEMEVGENQPARKRTRRRTQLATSQSQNTQSSSGSASASSSDTGLITADKMKDFKSLLFKYFNKERAQVLTVKSIYEYMKENSKLGDADVKNALSTMHLDNQIMIADDNVFMI